MNDTHQNDRTLSDVFGLVLFAAGAFGSTLLVLALTDDPVSGQASTGTAAMGHALLWAGGAIPVIMMSLACLTLGAIQFLGYQEAQRVTWHLGGVLGVAVGVSVVLGAFSESAGGRLGVVIGGGLSELLSAPVASLVGLGVICASAWTTWLTPSRARMWEKAQEIEKPAVPLQAKADGVTREESAALTFEGEPDALSEVTTSPYPEDVRILGEIPDGAAALGAEETSNHDEFTGQSEDDELEETSPPGPEATTGAESEEDALLLATEQGDEEPAGEDLVVGEEATTLDAAAPEDDLSASEAGEDAPEEEFMENSEADGESAQIEDEEPEVVHDETEEEDSKDGEDWEHDDSEYEEEGEDEAEEQEEEEDAGDEEQDEYEDEEVEKDDEREHEDAAELEEDELGEDSSEEQGDLFASGEEAQEPEVILEPQLKPAEDNEEILMKAADLFLDRDRVAVSLLQRQFHLDFEESCAVLDELQGMGLIGPYVGGNRRDILLTRDEWLERVGGAS